MYDQEWKYTINITDSKNNSKDNKFKRKFYKERETIILKYNFTIRIIYQRQNNHLIIGSTLQEIGYR